MTRKFETEVTIPDDNGTLIYWVEFRLDPDDLDNDPDVDKSVELTDWEPKRTQKFGRTKDVDSDIAFALNLLFENATHYWSPLLDKVCEQCVKAAQGEIEREQTPQPVDELTEIH